MNRILCAAIVFLTVLIVAAPVTARAAGEPVYITVHQTYLASDYPENATFTYKLISLDKENPMPTACMSGEYVFDITGNVSVRVGPLSFDTPGTYRYKLLEFISKPKEGCKYDKQVYFVEIFVSDSLDVSMVITKNDGTKSEDITFENDFDVIEVDPIVHKIVQGNPPEDSTFTFKLEALDASNPMPPGSADGMKTVTVTGSGMGDFGDIPYYRPGVYSYIVYEVNTGLRDYTYDKTVYTITDTIWEEDGKLKDSRVITDSSGREVTDLIFVNKYNPDSGIGGGRPGGTNSTTETPTGTSSKQSAYGPKTGDETDNTLYTLLFVLGGMSVIAAAAYLAVCGKRRKAG